MIEVTHILLINTGVSSIVLFVLFLMWMTKPTKHYETKEERVYLSKDMYKIKKQVADSEVEV